MTTDEKSAVAVWHLTAWFEGPPPDHRLLIRVEYTTEVGRRERVREQHKGVETTVASLQRFLRGLAEG